MSISSSLSLSLLTLWCLIEGMPNLTIIAVVAEQTGTPGKSFGIMNFAVKHFKLIDFSVKFIAECNSIFNDFPSMTGSLGMTFI